MEKKKKTRNPDPQPLGGVRGMPGIPADSRQRSQVVRNARQRCSRGDGLTVLVASPGRDSPGQPGLFTKHAFCCLKKIPSELPEASAATGVSTHSLVPWPLRAVCISLLCRCLGPSRPSGHGPWEEVFLKRFFISCCG
ncbi:unnamed protein product [Rangifer tarandus platyrhynchus]|uniref:Uncharacterized protein n=1 Tax=Rangifer tarandus platyrhynchus TaxID=3082113 RepID=A0AC59Z7L9_RANTA